MEPNNVQTLVGIGENFEYSLFKIAISFAENGLNVWFIAPETFETVPKNIKVPEKEILQLITFMYLKDHSDLITHLNGIHLWRKIPDVIIVTQFENYSKLYLDEYNPLQAALIATSLLDSAAVCAFKKQTKIRILVTCTEPSETSKKTRLETLVDLYLRDYICKNLDDELFIDNVITFFE